MPKTRKHKLNGRQKLFVGYYCEGETKGNCYASMIKAGYSEAYARHRANFMLSNVAICEAIAARRAEIADVEEITIETVLKSFMQELAVCKKAKDRVNTIRVLENLSKHVGLYEKDNKQQGNELPKLTPEEQAIIRANAIKITDKRNIA